MAEIASPSLGTNTDVAFIGAYKPFAECEAASRTKLAAKNLNLFYSGKQALHDVNIDIAAKQVTALIGPSGCGKSSFIRCFNRMNDLIDGCKVDGEVVLDGNDIYSPDQDVVALRSRVGMVFQKPNPFPKSIFDNVAYGPRILGMADSRSEMDEIVKTSLTSAGLYDEVKSRLDAPGLSLSGGQQQRLCIARAIAVRPEVLLMDEPCSALDPIATSKIEALIQELREDYTIVIVTHSMQQARRVSDQTAYFHLGRLVEHGETGRVFDCPEDERLRDYVMGRIG